MSTIVSVRPQFGLNYRVGDIGFTYTDNNFISIGIAWFTRWERGSNPDVPNIPVSHVFVVSGDNECIEATLPRVKRTKLDEYFNSDHTHVFFRRPVDITPEIGDRIVTSAATKIGQPYGTLLLLGHAIADSIPGKALGWITCGWFTRKAKLAFDSKQQYICSELASYALSSQPEYKGKGVLANPPGTVDPVALFNTKDVFKPWSYKPTGDVVSAPEAAPEFHWT